MSPSQPDKIQLPAMRTADLIACMQKWRQPSYRAKQIMEWRNKGVLDPDTMRNLPSPLIAAMKQDLDCQPLTMERRMLSRDGTRKYLFSLASGREIETVFIPETGRGTVCVSSQAGCVFNCPFCFTGTQGFEVNLTAGEIVAQVLTVKCDLRENPIHADYAGIVTHVVYMGMGEPLANEKSLYESLSVLMKSDGIGLSRRKLTVSTSGLIPAIERLGKAYPVNLAVSLHAAEDALRDQLVPINRKYPLTDLRLCLNRYPLGMQRHITLEYVMLNGVNDRSEDLAALADFVNPERERINLIHFNPYPGSSYRGTPESRINEFARKLTDLGLRATVRRSRGQDIMAACGQLKASDAG